MYAMKQRKLYDVERVRMLHQSVSVSCADAVVLTLKGSNDLRLNDRYFVHHV
jgi:hypothetical protein